MMCEEGNDNGGVTRENGASMEDDLANNNDQQKQSPMIGSSPVRNGYRLSPFCWLDSDTPNGLSLEINGKDGTISLRKQVDSDSGHSTSFDSTPCSLDNQLELTSAITSSPNDTLRNGDYELDRREKNTFLVDIHADTESSSLERIRNAIATCKKPSTSLESDTCKSTLDPVQLHGLETKRDEEEEARAIWRTRYLLSKRDDLSCSSSDSGDLSETDALSLSEEDERVYQSNPSSQESDNEQCTTKCKRNKKSAHSSSMNKTNDEECKDEDEDEEEEEEDTYSSASSTSCSEDSFEIGTIPPRRTGFPFSSSLSPPMDVGKSSSTNSTNDERHQQFCNEEIEEKLTSHTATRTTEQDNNIALPSLDHRSGLENVNSTITRLENVNSTITNQCCPSSSMGACSSGTTSLASTSSHQKRSINDELLDLDTGLPTLDFEKLEKQLADAAMEREMNQRKLMGVHVLRRLTIDDADQPRFHPPAPTKRPLKSNLGARLQSGMSLQICFMNDVLPTDDEEEDSEWVDEDEWESGIVPKSRSTPNLGIPSGSRNVGRSASSCDDSSKRASDLRRTMLDKHNSENHDFAKRQARLEEEAKVMLVKAKEAARMQMEMERQEKAKEIRTEKVTGVSNLGKRKLTRHQLTKMCITQLQIILNDMHSKIEALNDELVHLLMERDSLHMEQDSMLVDIEDLLQHHRSADLRLPDFLVSDPVFSDSFASSCNNNNKHIRFRIFKR